MHTWSRGAPWRWWGFRSAWPPTMSGLFLVTEGARPSLVAGLVTLASIAAVGLVIACGGSVLPLAWAVFVGAGRGG